MKAIKGTVPAAARTRYAAATALLATEWTPRVVRALAKPLAHNELFRGAAARLNVAGGAR